jgi:hypothetical protein
MDCRGAASTKECVESSEEVFNITMDMVQKRIKKKKGRKRGKEW